MTLEIPPDSVGLKLYRIVRDDLIACESIRFVNGYNAVYTTLLRASLSGRVDVGGEIQNHFADILDDNHDITETVALDAQSYRALKTKWARCKLESREPPTTTHPDGR